MSILGEMLLALVGLAMMVLAALANLKLGDLFRWYRRYEHVGLGVWSFAAMLLYTLILALLLRGGE